MKKKSIILVFLAKNSTRKFLILSMRVKLNSKKPSLKKREDISSEAKTGQSAELSNISTNSVRLHENCGAMKLS